MLRRRTAIGCSNARIIFRHVLPNCLAPIIVQATLGVASAILAASSMSFLGLGLAAPHRPSGAPCSPSAGTYIRDYLASGHLPRHGNHDRGLGA